MYPESKENIVFISPRENDFVMSPFKYKVAANVTTRKVILNLAISAHWQ